jgi:hypothetical protein
VVSPSGGLTQNGSGAQIRITPGGAYFVAWLAAARRAAPISRTARF